MVLSCTDIVCESALDTTQTWYDFVDSLRRKLTRREFKSKNSNSRINNTTLDLEQNYSYSNSNQNPLINNIQIDQQPYTDEDHAWLQYYIPTVSQEGWNVEL